VTNHFTFLIIVAGMNKGCRVFCKIRIRLDCSGSSRVLLQRCPFQIKNWVDTSARGGIRNSIQMPYSRGDHVPATFKSYVENRNSCRKLLGTTQSMCYPSGSVRLFADYKRIHALDTVPILAY